MKNSCHQPTLEGCCDYQKISELLKHFKIYMTVVIIVSGEAEEVIV